MMHVYICTECKKAYMISRRKQVNCPVCGQEMIFCPTDFNAWVEMNLAQRHELIKAACTKK